MPIASTNTSSSLFVILTCCAFQFIMHGSLYSSLVKLRNNSYIPVEIRPENRPLRAISAEIAALIAMLINNPILAIISGIYLLGIKSRLFLITKPIQRHIPTVTGAEYFIRKLKSSIPFTPLLSYLHCL